jgi:hypothetical protein
VPPPTTEEIEALLLRIVSRVRRCVARGRNASDNVPLDTLDEMRAASAAERSAGAFEGRAGRYEAGPFARSLRSLDLVGALVDGTLLVLSVEHEAEDNGLTELPRRCRVTRYTIPNDVPNFLRELTTSDGPAGVLVGPAKRASTRWSVCAASLRPASTTNLQG